MRNGGSTFNGRTDFRGAGDRRFHAGIVVEGIHNGSRDVVIDLARATNVNRVTDDEFESGVG